MRWEVNQIGDSKIKADAVLSAFENYRMQSRLYRFLKKTRLLKLIHIIWR